MRSANGRQDGPDGPEWRLLGWLIRPCRDELGFPNGHLVVEGPVMPDGVAMPLSVADASLLSSAISEAAWWAHEHHMPPS